MGMTDNQLSLVRYVAEMNMPKARQAAIFCCLEDKTQKNHYAVGKYINILQNRTETDITLPSDLAGFASIEDLSNTYLENRYYLSYREEQMYKLIKQMHDVSLQMMERKIPYLNATLLYGESGVGKTAFSRYVAYKLNLPYLYISMSCMVASYLGSTAKNIQKLFDFLNQQPCVAMFDEVDSLASCRNYSDGSSSGEISRSISYILQRLDQVPNNQVIIAATNLPDSIDPAFKRRFTHKHEVHKLDVTDNIKFISQYLCDAQIDFDYDSVCKYAATEPNQADIMTHISQKIAEMLLDNKSVLLM